MSIAVFGYEAWALKRSSDAGITNSGLIITAFLVCGRLGFRAIACIEKAVYALSRMALYL